MSLDDGALRHTETAVPAPASKSRARPGALPRAAIAAAVRLPVAGPLRRTRSALLALAIVGATTGETAAAVFTVSTTADDGAGSLRQAILDANSAAGADSVVFAATATGTILLLSALPEVTDDLDILGPGAGVLTVDGAGSFRVLAFGGTSTATISGLTIANGAVIDDVGGGIFNSGSAILTISDTVLSGNTATRGSSFFGFAAGGAIANFGRLTILRTTLAVNRATGSSAGNDAGGIQNGGTLTIVDSTSRATGRMAEVEASAVSARSSSPTAPSRATRRPLAVVASSTRERRRSATARSRATPPAGSSTRTSATW